MSAKDTLRRFTRSKLGLDFGNWSFTPAARRVQLWQHYGIATLVDVGANVGQYATEARKAGYAGRIVSIEPVSAAFSRLEEAAAPDPSWDVRQVAVGASAGSISMHISEGSIFSSPLQIREEAVTASPNARQVGTEEVPVVTLDELVPDVDLHHAIKIDVQGFERDVLLGGEHAMRSARIVELELTPRPVYDGQMLMIEALQRMEDLGLILALTENIFPEIETGRSLQFNGIFVRP